jgi:hypothetical protein
MRKRDLLLLSALLLQTSCGAVFADPLKGGVEQKQVITPGMQGGADAYPAPQMVPQTPVYQAPPPPRKPLNAEVRQSAPREAPPPPRQPMQIGIQKQVVLPQGFMGAWRVQGQRSKVEALPDFQAGAEQAFALNTNNVWNINGSPGNYSMSNGEMSTQLWVDKVEGGTAFIRYQHPVGKTMAQEAIVLSLVPGGVQFNGLERISIVKEGLPQPRAKVTYQLNGQRQR